MDHTMTREQVEELIEEHQQVVFLNYSGGVIMTEEELWEEYDEGWRLGVVTQPISNTLAELWIVATANHRDHYGFDGGEVFEAVVAYEQREYSPFYEEWSEAGGMIYEVAKEEEDAADGS
jgi:hypothetical protein